MRVAPTLVLPLALVTFALPAVLLSGCAERRIEHYYTTTDSQITLVPGQRWQVLYFKQSMRHAYVLLALTNSGDQPLTVKRVGPGAATITMDASGQTVLPDPPTRATWTPWTGTVERTAEQTAQQVVAPNGTEYLYLRFDFPATTPTFDFAWTVRVAGLTRGGEVQPEVVIPRPAPPEDRPGTEVIEVEVGTGKGKLGPASGHGSSTR